MKLSLQLIILIYFTFFFVFECIKEIHKTKKQNESQSI
jgi:hypothetical protein